MTAYVRRLSHEVNIGGLAMGGNNPIRVQSMTTVDTMDTKGSVDQCIRMIESGCEYIRITAPSMKEAENLRHIKNELRAAGFETPLIADIHYTPNAAELAARIVEKVRVNPGNYADKKKFEVIEYTDSSYQEELDRIREKFTPLVKICKEEGTAMRIGTNHGSLSDRIMSRFGDTPIGMVESALEFLRICDDLDYHNIVLSMKSSNTQVMVQAYRLLVNKLNEEGLKPYPLHLGVTEAGEGEDGRIKSAVGIGTLLEDGLGDTVRVSLTEEPEFEAPVAKSLIDRYTNRTGHAEIDTIGRLNYDPFNYRRRTSQEVANVGGSNVPRVMMDLSNVEVTVASLADVGYHYVSELDKWTMTDQGADYIYTGKKSPDFMLPNGLKQIMDLKYWQNLKDTNAYPLMSIAELPTLQLPHAELNFVRIYTHEFTEPNLQKLKGREGIVLILISNNEHAMADLRRAFIQLRDSEIDLPVIIRRTFEVDTETLQLHASTDLGGLLIDGFGDGVIIRNEPSTNQEINQLAFGVLQAARTRMTKTEYISCPSCGRTLFDLQETTAMIRKRTDHLKGVKIGIMGCIVNGPGEMADADYGYVGSGKGKITLYRGQDVVKRSVPSENAVDELIEIIREDGNWIEKETI